MKKSAIADWRHMSNDEHWRPGLLHRWNNNCNLSSRIHSPTEFFWTTANLRISLCSYVRTHTLSYLKYY